MLNGRDVARLGMLAVGIGPWSGGGSLAGRLGRLVHRLVVVDRQPSDGWSPPGHVDLDYQISIDGHGLFPTMGNLATATSGTNDIAIAYGDGANASATGGTSASTATDSAATAGGEYGTDIVGNYGIATVFDPTGTVGSFAGAGADASDPGSYDLAGAFGDGLAAFAQGSNFLFEVLPSLF